MVDDDVARYALDDEHAELYRLWAEARSKRVTWEAQEKAARDQLIELFAATTGKAVLATVDSRPVCRLTRVSYFALNQSELRRHHPEIFEAYYTKEISFDRIDEVAQTDVELAG